MVIENVHDTENFKLNRNDFAIYCRCLYSYMKKGPYQTEMIELFNQVASYLDMSILEKYKQQKNNRRIRSEEIFERFILDVKEYCSLHRDVRFYADKLSVSSKYLSQISKEISNKTANDWINEFVILEIKSLLKSTNLTIKEISYRMNFTNQSFFGKYFKKHLGIAPKKYVRSIVDKE